MEIVTNNNYDTCWKNYKFKIYPNEDQKKQLDFIMDCARFVYNWGLAYWMDYYAKYKKAPKKYSIMKEFVSYRHNHPWLEQCDLTTCRHSIIHVNDAYNRYFKNNCNGKCYPKFKKKHKAKRTAQMRGNRVYFYDDYIKIPGIESRILCKPNKLRNSSKHPKRVYISYDGNNYWISMSIEYRYPFNLQEYDYNRNEPLGVDVGIRTSAYLSDGTRYGPPDKHRVNTLINRIKKLESAIDRSRRRKRKLSARTKTKYDDIPDSNNQIKRMSKYRQAHRDLANLYKTHYHNISRDIVNKNPEFVVLEDFDIRAAQRSANNGLSSSLHNARLGILLHQIEYKCLDIHIPVIYADKDYPSTQLCSVCGGRYKVHDSEIYNCPHCGNVMNRDYNASLNLLKFGRNAIAKASI